MHWIQWTTEDADHLYDHNWAFVATLLEAMDAADAKPLVWSASDMRFDGGPPTTTEWGWGGPTPELLWSGQVHDIAHRMRVEEAKHSDCDWFNRIVAATFFSCLAGNRSQLQLQTYNDNTGELVQGARSCLRVNDVDLYWVIAQSGAVIDAVRSCLTSDCKVYREN